LAWALLTSGDFRSECDNGGRPWLHLPLAPSAPSRRLLVPAASCSAPPLVTLLRPARLLEMAHLPVSARDGWVAGWWGSSPNNFFAICFEPISKMDYAGGRLCHPPALWFRGGGRAPASKDSHFSWHKTASGCCARQHKCVLAASTNRFWPSCSASESRD
jgi:hypothetical protein